jgi:acetoin utilization deacetylase AcuC-like enzyme
MEGQREAFVDALLVPGPEGDVAVPLTRRLLVLLTEKTETVASWLFRWVCCNCTSPNELEPTDETVQFASVLAARAAAARRRFLRRRLAHLESTLTHAETDLAASADSLEGQFQREELGRLIESIRSKLEGSSEASDLAVLQAAPPVPPDATPPPTATCAECGMPPVSVSYQDGELLALTLGVSEAQAIHQVSSRSQCGLYHILDEGRPRIPLGGILNPDRAQYFQIAQHRAGTPVVDDWESEWRAWDVAESSVSSQQQEQEDPSTEQEEDRHSSSEHPHLIDDWFAMPLSAALSDPLAVEPLAAVVDKPRATIPSTVDDDPPVASAPSKVPALRARWRRAAQAVRSKQLLGFNPAGTSIFKTLSCPSAPLVSVAYDSRMLLHAESPKPQLKPPFPGLPPPLQPPHPERPDRLRCVAEHLVATGLFQRCLRVPSRRVRRDEITLCHTPGHFDLIDSLRESGDQRFGTDTFANAHTHTAALLAAGCVVSVTEAVMTGRSRSGIALVRPPGHHAEPDAAMGFCLLNNSAIAAAVALRDFGAKRVLILDWDVHHGNGTQDIFFHDDRVMYISIHRYEPGFFPGTGSPADVGVGKGRGYNVNIGWSQGGMGDADYATAFDQVIMPVARQFSPDLVIVSAGFDAAAGDPLGGCEVTPAGYAMMTSRLRELANGRLVIALEGGYSLAAIALCTEAVVRVLQGEPPPPLPPLPQLRRSDLWGGAPTSPVAVARHTDAAASREEQAGKARLASVHGHTHPPPVQHPPPLAHPTSPKQVPHSAPHLSWLRVDPLPQSHATTLEEKDEHALHADASTEGDSDAASQSSSDVLPGPCRAAVLDIMNTIDAHAGFWSSLRRMRAGSRWAAAELFWTQAEAIRARELQHLTSSYVSQQADAVDVHGAGSLSPDMMSPTSRQILLEREAASKQQVSVRQLFAGITFEKLESDELPVPSSSDNDDSDSSSQSGGAEEGGEPSSPDDARERAESSADSDGLGILPQQGAGEVPEFITTILSSIGSPVKRPGSPPMEEPMEKRVKLG